MKKMKVLLVGILTLIMSFMCFSGCALLKMGKYKAVSYQSVSILGASVTTELPEDNGSYVELKGDNVAVICIKVDSTDWSKEGTWKENDDGTITITVGGVDYTTTIEGGTMVLDLGIIGKFTFKK